MYNRKALKQEAKQLMRASVPHFMLVALVYVLLTTGLSYVVTWLTDGSGFLTGVLSVFLNILVSLFSMVMSVGFVHYALRLARKEKTGIGSLFEGFSFAGRAIGVNLLVTVYLVLWMLLLGICAGILVTVVLLTLESLPVAAGILTAVLYIAMIVAVYAIVLRYAMASFALVDNPDAGVAEAIRRSVRMMRGHKRRLFVLELSFIGWYLLVFLIVLVVLVIGVIVTGATEVFETLILTGEDFYEVYGVLEGLAAKLLLWSMLAELLSLPLTLWLTVYQQTALARFYNYVGGYDYHQYMNAQQIPSAAPGAEPEQSVPTAQPERSAHPPSGGYYTPAPTLEGPAEVESPPEEPAPVESPPEEPAPSVSAPAPEQVESVESNPAQEAEEPEGPGEDEEDETEEL